MLSFGLRCLLILSALMGLGVCQPAQVLSTIDVINNPLDAMVPIPAFFMGLSIPFNTIYQNFSSTLLQAYIKNSLVYNSYLGGFQISLKMQTPKGSKFNCTFYQTFAPNATCTIDVNSYLSAIGRFFNATIGFGDQQFLGYDM